MTAKVRSITLEESMVVEQRQRCDDVIRYRRARILRLSAGCWRCPTTAEALAPHAQTVRDRLCLAVTEGPLAPVKKWPSRQRTRRVKGRRQKQGGPPGYRAN